MKNTQFLPGRPITLYGRTGYFKTADGQILAESVSLAAIAVSRETGISVTKIKSLLNRNMQLVDASKDEQGYIRISQLRTVLSEALGALKNAIARKKERQENTELTLAGHNLQTVIGGDWKGWMIDPAGQHWTRQRQQCLAKIYHDHDYPLQMVETFLLNHPSLVWKIGSYSLCGYEVILGALQRDKQTVPTEHETMKAKEF